MRFSIIIPTLNEQKYIGTLLKGLVYQTFRDFEVIVVDGKSTDLTKEIVTSYSTKLNVRLLEAPKRGVGFQRNYGAQHSKANVLIFFDADTFVEKDFLKKIDEQIKLKSLDVLTVWNIPISERVIDHVMLYFFNIGYLETNKKILPGAVGTFICVSKKAFDGVNGFDETITLGEDFDLVKRVFKKGYKYGLLRDPVVYFSVRRLNKEGRLSFGLKMLRGFFYYHFRGPIKDAVKFKHEFGNHL